MKGKTPAGQAKKTGNAGISKGAKLTLVICALPLVAIMFSTFLVVALTMLPTVVAYLVDRTREKYLAVTVGLMNICGALPAVVKVWEEGRSDHAAIATLMDVFTWLAAYAAAAVGWAIYLGMEHVTESYYVVATKSRILALSRDQQKLAEEWGEEVAEGLSGSLEDFAESQEETESRAETQRPAA